MENKNIKNLNDEEKFALFYGIMLGDGCLSQYKSKYGSNGYAVSITCSYKDDQEFFKEIVLPLTIFIRGKSINIKQRPKKGTIELNFNDKELFGKLKNYFPVGKKGKDLKISNFFYEKNLIKFVLQGFFATDGSIVLTKNPNKLYPRLEAHVIHKKLIEQFYLYMTNLGFKGHMYECKRIKQESRWNVQDRYRFQFNGRDNLNLFHEKIGFVNPKHEKKYQDFINKNKVMAIPGV